ncbi:porin [Pseudorhodoplanes sp.]|uniref:porin n=1 Tax=Pseudorhodoplanes sp. TaxID=1934341 RepID=UPI002BD96EA3|nr:porin [Pseudorhodoplanes sp.]HWV52817.1 porin [Pseudorhodoplanes sp.]
MKATLIAILLALVTAAPAFAQSKAPTKPKSEPAPKADPAKRANPCAEYGAGFVQVEGTGTCVQVRGYVRMQGSVR